MSDSKVSKKDVITWGIIIGGWIFAGAGYMFQIKDHEKRITKVEDRYEKEKWVSGEDFRASVKDLWQAVRRR